MWPDKPPEKFPAGREKSLHEYDPSRSLSLSAARGLRPNGTRYLKPDTRPERRRESIARLSYPIRKLRAPHRSVVADQDRSREWYTKVLGAKTLNERDPVIMKVANGWIILNVGAEARTEAQGHS